MIRKKMLAAALICTLTISGSGRCQSFGAEATYDNPICDNFELDKCGWAARGDETVELNTEESYSGEQSIKISNRTETWNGASSDKTAELTLGETYNFGIWIKYIGDAYSKTYDFSLQLQYNDGVNDQYKTIKSGTVTKGKWTHLEGEYTIPTDAENVNVYVETAYNTSPSAQDLLDFYLDDFTAVPAVLPEIETNIASLKEVYSSYFNIGCATTANEIAPKPAKELVRKQYNCITPGNELKPDSVLDYDATIAYMKKNNEDQTNPQVNIRAAKTILEFAKDNDIPVRGHTLVWHAQTPDWFFKKNYSKDFGAAWASKEVMLQRLENYIKNLMALLKKTYPTVKFYAWDVVNEAVDPNTSTGMRNPGSNNTTSGNSSWMKTVGETYIVKAFSYARKYAPKSCKLFYNDYNEYEAKKSEFIIKILKELKAKGLIDGMGMQSHWTMDYPSINMFETAARKYDALGLEIQLTELDMKQPDNSTSTLSSQASRYKLLMNKVIALKKEGVNITAVILWGITDRTSWLGGYPLLFDGEYKAKPAFYAITDGVTPIGSVSPVPTIPAQVSITPTPIPGVIITPTLVPTTKPTIIPGEAVPTVTVVTKNSGNSINQTYIVTAKGKTIDLSKLTIKYTADCMSNDEQNVWCDTAALEFNREPWYTSVTKKVKGKVTDAILVLTINSNLQLQEENDRLVMNIRFAKKNWTSYGKLNNESVNLYYDGKLIQ
jgi:endo-1,4-beta-xylanase